MAKYGWFRSCGLDAEAVGAEVEAMGDAVTPEAVVSVARNPQSPMHKAFQWDDAKAAVAHRLWQAREMLGNLAVVIVTAGGEEKARALHSVVVSTGEEQYQRAYVQTRVIVQHISLRQQVIEAFEADIANAERRIGELDLVQADQARVARHLGRARAVVRSSRRKPDSTSPPA